MQKLSMVLDNILLHLKFQNWCGTDRIVLIKTIRMLFKKLFEDQGGSPDLVGAKQVVAIANGQWEAECIDYVVSNCHFKSPKILGIDFYILQFTTRLLGYGIGDTYQHFSFWNAAILNYIKFMHRIINWQLFYFSQFRSMPSPSPSTRPWLVF